MFGVDFTQFSPWINAAVFAAAAGAVWAAGSRLSLYADGITEKTRLGEAFAGLLLLAVATEMPEIGTTTTASAVGNAQLAIGNLFGSVIVNSAIVAVVDLTMVRAALTYFAPSPVLLLQGVLVALLLALTLAAATAGELFTFFGIGLWSILLFIVYIGGLYLSQGYEGRDSWQPDDVDEAVMEEEKEENAAEPDQKHADWSLKRLVLFFAGASLVILVAGVILATVGETLADQVGLSQTFVGTSLLSASTSLPELSTSIAAARLGNYSMAISNIFGSNAIMVALILLADLFYRPGPILQTVEAGSMFTVAIGIVVTCAYLVGMLERRNQVFLRMGIDSITVLLLYIGSLVVLYFIS